MKRILTGIQCTGRPHLGNVLGAMLPTLQLANDADNQTFIFLADLHTLTTLKDSEERKKHVFATTAAWLALGLDIEKVIFYRQSKIPSVCELVWYLSCFTPYPMLANAHAFKDKSDRIASVSAGLFTYPILMAADILLYQTDIVPVGKDQLQHVEITRDLANSFNKQYGPTFILPKPLIDNTIAIVPGTDGQKMSKSYHNTIDIFLPEKDLKRSVMGIQTDSKSVTDSKDPDQCTIFKLYSLLATTTETDTMRTYYIAGGYGYGQAKTALLEVILDRFAEAREKFTGYIADTDNLEAALRMGENKAKQIATQTLDGIRKKLGY